ncbi:MAG: right-handed parallel beta-helix repeat-containing protein [Thermoplasmata archaeon]|nr:MAG: right-handed parallel beta-helix repeat-containing protein [Thermoplasmata archaeon]
MNRTARYEKGPSDEKRKGRLSTLFLVFMMLFSLIIVTDITLDIVTFSSSGTTFYVNITGSGGAYTKIQDAINMSNDGDTVFVYSGTYYENVRVNRTINLTGEDRDTTIIDGGGSGDVVWVTSHWVNLTGFTIKNSGSAWEDAGLRIWSDNNTIYNNNVSNNFAGIYVSGDDGNLISSNIIYWNSLCGLDLDYSHGTNFTNNAMLLSGIIIDGMTDVGFWNSHEIDASNTLNGKPIYYLKDQTSGVVPPGAGQVILANCFGVTIENQELNNGSTGISLGFSHNNHIIDNNISYNIRDGIYMYSSFYNNITGNTIQDLHNGVFLSYSDGNNLTGNDILSCRYKGIYLRQSNENNFYNNNISNNRYDVNTEGTLLWYSDSNNFTANNFSNNRVGIYIDSDCRSNRIAENTFSSNGYFAVYVFGSDTINNVIFNNTISNNYGGIKLRYPDSNDISYNIILSNYNGILMEESSNYNIIHHNYIIGNSKQVFLDTATCTGNVWDDGNGEGNYWSDYSGVDDGSGGRIWGDGVGDTEIPHPITDQGDGYFQLDNYPLVDPDPKALLPRAGHLGVEGHLEMTPGIQHIVPSQPVFNFTYRDFNSDDLSAYNVSVLNTTGETLLWWYNTTDSIFSGSNVSVTYNTLPYPTDGPFLEDGKTYKLWVNVANVSGLWGVGFEVDFHMNEVLSPNLGSPADNSRIEASETQIVSWSSPGVDFEGDSPVFYNWEVATDSGFTDIIESGSGSQTTSGQFDTRPSGSYYWRMSLNDGWETGFFGNQPEGFWNFTTFTPPPNNPPVITNGAEVPTKAYVGIEFTFTFLAFDADSDPLSWSKSSGAGWLGIGVTIGTVSGTPSSGDLGFNDFTIQVGDGRGGTDNYTFTIEVEPTPTSNNPPVITNKDFVPRAIGVNYSFSFAFTASDPDSDPLLWSKISGANWLLIGATNGTIYGTPSLADLGSSEFSIQVSDGKGGTDNHTFTITVDVVEDGDGDDKEDDNFVLLWVFIIIIILIIVLLLFMLTRRRKKGEVTKPPSAGQVQDIPENELLPGVNELEEEGSHNSDGAI